jgi:hypothetical protein
MSTFDQATNSAGTGAAIGTAIAPGIGTAIGAGAGFLGSMLFGRDKGSKRVDSQLDQINRRAEQRDARADGYFGQVDDFTSLLSNYLKPILGGDRDAMLAAVEPEVSNVMDQYDTAYQKINEFGPRGGGRTGALADLEGGRARDVSTLINTTRRDAFGKAQTLQQFLGTLGISLDAQSSNDLARALAGLQGKELNEREDNAAMGDAIGGIIAQLLFKDKE